MLPIWTGNNVEEVNRAALALALTGPQGVTEHEIHYGQGMGALTDRKGSLVTVRVGDSVYVTNKPICDSLVSGPWHCGPYAGCHVRRYAGEDRHYFFLTVYRNGNRPYHRGTKKAWHSELHTAARLLREHALQHWFAH